MIYVVLILGVVFVIVSFRQILLSWRCQKWKSTGGEIIKSETRLIKSQAHRSDDSYYADIIYSYEVYGECFESSRLSFKGRSSSEVGAKSLTSLYPKGKKIIVYYDPKNPKQAVLEQGFSWLGIFFLLFGFALIAFFFYLLNN
jgi:hypothetical protein